MKSFLGWMNEKPKTSSNLMDHVLNGPKDRAEAERILKERGIDKPQNPHPSRRMECAPDPKDMLAAINTGFDQGELLTENLDYMRNYNATTMDQINDTVFATTANMLIQLIKDRNQIQQCMNDQDAEYERQMQEYNQQVSRLMPKLPARTPLWESKMEKDGREYWTAHWRCQKEHAEWEAKWAKYHEIRKKYALTIDGWKESDERIRAKAENAQRYYELITADTGFLSEMYWLPYKYAEYLEWQKSRLIPDDGLKYRINDGTTKYDFQEIKERVQARNSTRTQDAMTMESLADKLERTKPRFK